MSAQRKEGQGRKCGGEKELEVQCQAVCETPKIQKLKKAPADGLFGCDFMLKDSLAVKYEVILPKVDNINQLITESDKQITQHKQQVDTTA